MLVAVIMVFKSPSLGDGCRRIRTRGAQDNSCRNESCTDVSQRTVVMLNA